MKLKTYEITPVISQGLDSSAYKRNASLKYISATYSQNLTPQKRTLGRCFHSSFRIFTFYLKLLNFEQSKIYTFLMVSTFKIPLLRQPRRLQTSPMSNDSSQEHAFDLLLCEDELGAGLTIVGLVCMFFIIISCLFGNTLVCVACVKCLYLQSFSEQFIFSLALSDIMVAASVLPFDIVYWITFPRWPLGAYVCNLWNALFFLFLTASVLNLTSISIDRFLAVVYPLRYSVWMTPNLVKFMIACVWVYSLGIAVLIFFLLDPPENQTYSFNLNPLFHGFLLIGNVIIPFIIMIILYSKIYIIAKRHARRAGITSSSANTSSLTRRTNSFARELKLAKTLGIVVLCFVICWLPFEIINVIILVDQGVTTCLVEIIDTVACWLAYLHSSFNPLVYAFSSSEFRRAFRKLLCKREWTSNLEVRMIIDSQSNTAGPRAVGSASAVKPQES